MRLQVGLSVKDGRALAGARSRVRSECVPSDGH